LKAFWFKQLKQIMKKAMQSKNVNKEMLLKTSCQGGVKINPEIPFVQQSLFEHV
jgi:hypothetical protein